ncbi:MAG TPA: YggS family pyridoxal phosphate-dependent enzyme [Planctomycetota bacterium]|nr:YggS family pyridoxal phosphate-dependent enzyme [Planctomycetota bacterium]
MPSPPVALRVRENLLRVRERIEAACRRAKRQPGEITLVAVTKSASPGEVEAILELGVRDLGESRAIEGSARAAQFGPDVRWHFIGHLQTNKAKRVVEAFQVVHSVDRAGLVDELERRAAGRNRRLPMFVQVNVSGEATKGGFRPEETAAAVGQPRSAKPHLDVVGLMTMAPEGPPESARPHFRKLRELAAACGLSGLSMGMTGDFEVAIEEGATHIRVGTALFGSSNRVY